MPYLTTKMIGRLEKDYRPVLDAFEKELSTDVADPKQTASRAYWLRPALRCDPRTAAMPRALETRRTNVLQHARHQIASVLGVPRPAQGQPKIALPIVIGALDGPISIHARCSVKVRLDEPFSGQRVAQHLDKSSTGNLIAVLAVLGILKRQIAGGR
jgi:hypothetical protein